MKSASWATRAIKRGKQLLKLPKRPGVPFGGQAGFSDDAVTGSKARAGLPGLVGERWPAQLVATAAENRCKVELQMPKASAGRFTQQALRFGFLAT